MTIKPQTVFRVDAASRNFTTISNALLQDARLSHETRGLLCELLSRARDWEITVRGLIATGPSGREKIYRLLKEAETYGYISRDQMRRDDGAMGKHFYVVRDDPEASGDRVRQSRIAAEPEAADRLRQNRIAAEPDTADQPQQKKESKKIKIEQKNTSTSSCASAVFIEDDEGIRTSAFSLTWAWVEAAAELESVPAAEARKLAKVLALELIQGPAGGKAGYYATFRRMLREHGGARRPSEARQASAAAAGKPHWRDEQAATVEAVRGALVKARAAELAGAAQ
jgi:hypothetical protein